METQRKAPQYTPPSRQGLIAQSFGLLTRFIGLLLFSIVLSIIIEWVGMGFIYPKQGYDGYEHALELAYQEINYINDARQNGSLIDPLLKQAEERAESAIKDFGEGKAVLAFLDDFRKKQGGENFVGLLVSDIIEVCYDYIVAAVLIIATSLIRLTILFFSIPTFLLFAIVGVSDGFMQRDLRRWSGGKESGYIYHWAKRFALPVLYTCWVIYLALPFSLHPNLIITPFAALFGLILMTMSSKFKKYL